jgi:hypothetical protein
VSDAACDSFSVRAGRLQRLVADAGSLPGDVQRPCHARGRDAVHVRLRLGSFQARGRRQVLRRRDRSRRFRKQALQTRRRPASAERSRRESPQATAGK